MSGTQLKDLSSGPVSSGISHAATFRWQWGLDVQDGTGHPGWPWDWSSKMAAGLVIQDLLPSPACVLGMGGWEARLSQDIGMTRVVSLWGLWVPPSLHGLST